MGERVRGCMGASIKKDYKFGYLETSVICFRDIPKVSTYLSRDITKVRFKLLVFEGNVIFPW